MTEKLVKDTIVEILFSLDSLEKRIHSLELTAARQREWAARNGIVIPVDSEENRLNELSKVQVSPDRQNQQHQKFNSDLLMRHSSDMDGSI